jgi:hypothetical protein
MTMPSSFQHAPVGKQNGAGAPNWVKSQHCVPEKQSCAAGEQLPTTH